MIKPIKVKMPIRWARGHRDMINRMMHIIMFGDPRKDLDPNSPTHGQIIK